MEKHELNNPGDVSLPELQKQYDAVCERLNSLQIEENAYQRDLSTLRTEAARKMAESTMMGVAPALSQHLRLESNAISQQVSKLCLERGEASPGGRARAREMINLRNQRTKLGAQLQKAKLEAQRAARDERKVDREQHKETARSEKEETKARLAAKRESVHERAAALKSQMVERRAQALGEDYESLSAEEKQVRAAALRQQRLDQLTSMTAQKVIAGMGSGNSGSSSVSNGDSNSGPSPIVPTAAGAATTTSVAVPLALSLPTPPVTATSANSEKRGGDDDFAGLDDHIKQELAKLPRQFIYDEDDIDVEAFLAAGGGGSCYRCKIISQGNRPCAGKTFSSTDPKDAMREICISRTLHHPNLIQTLGVVVTSKASALHPSSASSVAAAAASGRGCKRKKELLMLMELGTGSLSTLLKAASASATNTRTSASSVGSKNSRSSSHMTGSSGKGKKDHHDDDDGDDDAPLHNASRHVSERRNSSGSDDDEHRTGGHEEKEEPSHSLPFDLCIDYANQIASGLAYLHDENKPAGRILLLDLKPHNILLCGDGRNLKLIDFGLARKMSSIDTTSTNVTGALGAGTLRYLPPEALNSAKTRPARDVYSFGVVLAYLVTGCEPFGANATVFKIVSTKLVDVLPPPRHGCPESLAVLMRECLDPDYKKRPKDGAELVQRLQQCAVDFESMLITQQSVASGAASGASDQQFSNEYSSSATFGSSNSHSMIRATPSSVLAAHQTSALLANAQQQQAAAGGSGGANSGALPDATLTQHFSVEVDVTY